MNTATASPQSLPQEPSMKDLFSLFNSVSKRFVNQFVVDEQNKESIKALLLYFNGSPSFEKLETIKNPSLNKGILLQGNVGSGKTLLMRIFSMMTNNGFKIKGCQEIAARYAVDGYKGITEYLSNNYCFDDLGTENRQKHFGNDENIMSNIISQRYDRFIINSNMTFITTNLQGPQILEYYGDRVNSRLKELCNVIILGDGNSMDRRNTAVPMPKNNRPQIYIEPEPVNIEEEKKIRQRQNYAALIDYYNVRGVMPIMWGWYDAYEYMKSEGIKQWTPEEEASYRDKASQVLLAEFEAKKAEWTQVKAKEEYELMLKHIDATAIKTMVGDYVIEIAKAI